MTATVTDDKGYSIDAITPKAGTGQNVTVGAASAESGAFTAGNQLVRVCSTTDCHVRVSAAGGTAVATDAFVPAKTPEYFRVLGGTHRIQVIRDTADGTLNIIEVE